MRVPGSRWGLLPKAASWLLVAFFAIRYTGGLYAWVTENRLEQPAYTVVRRLGHGVELRRYEAYNVAEATMKASLKEAASGGFRLCAGYLFGKNVPRERAGFLRPPPPEDVPGETMDMTAPVRQALAPSRGARTVKVSFVMSRKRPLGSLPVPRSAKVHLRTVPAHYAALVRFSGPPPTDDVVAKQEAVVRKAIEATGGAVRPVGKETLVLGYHDPFLVPNLLRRNEVGLMVTVAPDTLRE
ncbi:hypothetical protein KFE25_011058 [Diacronema lutheri]|uniref:SOUL heme-binding protein n=1 Tax=Diacronema lutheri TaxID=2081491 RepID=A0A8J5XFW5_DIALT|nr:hypothetical protein KFE25_011058 [Diacronema lutheri]